LLVAIHHSIAALQPTINASIPGYTIAIFASFVSLRVHERIATDCYRAICIASGRVPAIVADFTRITNSIAARFI
jgi:hypothetical protein